MIAVTIFICQSCFVIDPLDGRRFLESRTPQRRGRWREHWRARATCFQMPCQTRNLLEIPPIGAIARVSARRARRRTAEALTKKPKESQAAP
jgi:hypothetical protein